MSEDEVMAYLLSYAPLERYYLFSPPGSEDVLMKYIDSAGMPWNIMEDNDATVTSAVALLKRSGVKVFHDYSALLDFEQACSRNSN